MTAPRSENPTRGQPECQAGASPKKTFEMSDKLSVCRRKSLNKADLTPTHAIAELDLLTA